MNKDIYKNPIVYYIMVPALLWLWPVLLWGLYLPQAKENYKSQVENYKEARAKMLTILSLDPQRLEFTGSKTTQGQFDYVTVIDKVARANQIPARNYKLSSGRLSISDNQKTQSARVSVDEIDISRAAKFLSTLQLRWANLHCSQIKLTRKKGLPDKWKVDFQFRYYY